MKPVKIIIHCADTPNGKNQPSGNFYQWHVVERGWKAIGYHVIIQPDGKVNTYLNTPGMRAFYQMGSHAKEHNTDSIGICLVGKNKFTPAQFAALKDQSNFFLDNYKIPVLQTYCHYQFNTSKTCPNMKIDKLRFFLNSEDLQYVHDYVLKEITLA